MFGGHLVFSRGLSVGLIADDRLYLKVDDVTRAEFQAAGSEPFVYPSRNGPMEMSFWALPEEAADDPDMAAKWARLAVEAATRATAAKKAKGAGKKKVSAPAKKAKKPSRASRRVSRSR
jgi:DNA transformation protein